jgi:hypothetical protein
MSSDNNITTPFYLDAMEDNWQRVYGREIEELE